MCDTLGAEGCCSGMHEAQPAADTAAASRAAVRAATIALKVATAIAAEAEAVLKSAEVAPIEPAAADQAISRAQHARTQAREASRAKQAALAAAEDALLLATDKPATKVTVRLRERGQKPDIVKHEDLENGDVAHHNFEPRACSAPDLSTQRLDDEDRALELASCEMVRSISGL